ncbi:hypothetical protein EHI8A_146470 [Entamoeba histolytica HM-1:IMSS-B]|uniref:Pre-mRNA-splicing factor 38 n=6 Tax=Entamoeba histolytica TaxID=5759 RepID=C4M949_ENTH1|nr:hypothetical protein EHI_083650 [Entamoeba histolytica HM-1:IMSS]EMD48421.1 premRNA-splicing factor 38B, putative [Entamoeba histolytica KU27]EMH72607.1 hypothetical protein EHI8A_146470 [Entamoeba histolytica HM-1:IMSS-B]EMS16585.1 pre-mRNA-splicing factor 38B, putative [Entamoeba histolytica HM-3:IMSS]ENY61485.1 pre-mRNA-splicing factor 38B, putative [Entamoeba histolytica HM-1:IMSS-A]GAT98170.1 hypothetical protein CL6EHI_083650 [Entamoeba histolytica]|eukprot:XP_654426.1 hypothetical protein EHI_083650 [Entamoeba histolytica HM-1:IMSS]
MSEGKTLPTQGNTRTMNIDSILFTNITHSDYMFKTLGSIHSISDLIDIIINDVHYISPYIQKSSSSPSTAFCVLLRLFQLNPTPDDIRMMSTHSNKYVRCIAALIIRYSIQFNLLLSYLKPFVDDRAVVNISLHGEKTKQIKCLVKDLILEPKFEGCILPRIPQVYYKPLLEFFKGTSQPNSHELDEDSLTSFSDLKKFVQYSDHHQREHSRPPTSNLRYSRSCRQRSSYRERSRSDSRERRKNYYEERRYDSRKN